MSARLVLSDGSIFRGQSVGAPGTITGEAVFNTGMTGYQEVLSDPSYRGQLVTMTYPEIGNYGIAHSDMESNGVHLSGFIMKRCCKVPSNFRANESLPDFLQRHHIIGIEGIDTRALTRRLRVDGAMPAVISTENQSDAELIALAQNAPSMTGQDLASDAGSQEIYEWTESVDPGQFTQSIDWDHNGGHVVAIDFGVKHNILRLLKGCGFKVTVVPAKTSAAEILNLNPDGIFLSNGPGDPAAVTHAHDTVRELIAADKPMFGICLGHQILASALGAQTFKLKFGHRGSNHPIKRLSNGAVEIASHNHGFAVDANTLPDNVVMTHVNLNDHTCAGIAHKTQPIFSVQYHPEACPGPSDPLYLFKQFADHVRVAQ